MPAHASTLRVTLTGLGALALAMGIGRFAFTPLLPMMQEDGLVRLSEGAWLASVHFLGYWLGAVSAAMIPLAPRRALRVSLCAIALVTLAMGLTDLLPLWLALRWLAGLFSAWTLVLVSTHTVRHLGEAGGAARQGWVFAGVGAGICAAGLACLAFMALGAASASGWQVLGGASLVAACALAFAVGAELPATRPEGRRAAAARIPLAWRPIAAYGAAGLGYIIPATYLPVMARDSVPDPLVFGWSWPAFGAAAFVSTLLAARLRAGYGSRRIWVASQLVMAAGLLLPALLPHIAIIIVSGLAVGGTFMIVTMAGMQESHRIAAGPDVTRHIAVMTAAFATGQMLGPLLAGLLHDLSGSFAPSLVATAALLAVTALALGSGQPRKGEGHDPADRSRAPARP